MSQPVTTPVKLGVMGVQQGNPEYILTMWVQKLWPNGCVKSSFLEDRNVHGPVRLDDYQNLADEAGDPIFQSHPPYWNKVKHLFPEGMKPQPNNVRAPRAKSVCKPKWSYGA